MSDDHVLPIYIAILGTDALLAARPVEPLQLTRACYAAGFDFVAPVSWGEELIASHVIDRMAESGPVAAVAASCPFVGERLRTAPPRTLVFSTVSPPVACARYVREIFRPRPVHVTYVGGCPGAFTAEIDDRYLPDMLLAKLLEAGIDPSRQPRVLEAQLPVERARYASAPGGAPDADVLRARTGARLIEAALITVDAIAHDPSEDARLVDLASACRCVCARDRVAATRLEPPRASGPVMPKVNVSVVECAADKVLAPENADSKAPTRERVEADRRARFAENGLSGGDATFLSSIPHSLTTTREPW